MEGGNFVDYVKIYCKSGDGGPGSVHFRREKYVPKGGPDGGDGGRGGHIILKGNKQLWTLLHLKYRKHIKAKAGQGGAGALKSGLAGEDIYLEVPIGTVAKDFETGKVEFEITDDGQEVIWLPGGKGGWGNDHFKSPTNQTPRYAQPGIEGKEGWKILELKLLADVGLVGFPNAGKSTLLSVISAAKPEIADYPFTTIVPNLGVVSYRDNKSFVVADIPGIIEGAHSGKGLGTRFLRHIERNSVLLFIVPADSKNIIKEYKILLKELKLYNPELMQKEKLLAVSKSDLLDEELKTMIAKEFPKKLNYCFFSSHTQEGIATLKDELWKLLIKDLE
jgi:GTP-binding protein